MFPVSKETTKKSKNKFVLDDMLERKLEEMKKMAPLKVDVSPKQVSPAQMGSSLSTPGFGNASGPVTFMSVAGESSQSNLPMLPERSVGAVYDPLFWFHEMETGPDFSGSSGSFNSSGSAIQAMGSGTFNFPLRSSGSSSVRPGSGSVKRSGSGTFHGTPASAFGDSVGSGLQPGSSTGSLRFCNFSGISALPGSLELFRNFPGSSAGTAQESTDLLTAFPILKTPILHLKVLKDFPDTAWSNRHVTLVLHEIARQLPWARQEAISKLLERLGYDARRIHEIMAGNSAIDQASNDLQAVQAKIQILEEPVEDQTSKKVVLQDPTKDQKFHGESVQQVVLEKIGESEKDQRKIEDQVLQENLEELEFPGRPAEVEEDPKVQVEGISKNRVEEDDEVELLDHEDLTIATPLSHMQDVTENIQNLDANAAEPIENPLAAAVEDQIAKDPKILEEVQIQDDMHPQNPALESEDLMEAREAQTVQDFIEDPVTEVVEEVTELPEDRKDPEALHELENHNDPTAEDVEPDSVDFMDLLVDSDEALEKVELKDQKVSEQETSAKDQKKSEADKDLSGEGSEDQAPELGKGKDESVESKDPEVAEANLIPSVQRSGDLQATDSKESHSDKESKDPQVIDANMDRPDQGSESKDPSPLESKDHQVLKVKILPREGSVESKNHQAQEAGMVHPAHGSESKGTEDPNVLEPSPPAPKNPVEHNLEAQNPTDPPILADPAPPIRIKRKYVRKMKVPAAVGDVKPTRRTQKRKMLEDRDRTSMEEVVAKTEKKDQPEASEDLSDSREELSVAAGPQAPKKRRRGRMMEDPETARKRRKGRKLEASEDPRDQSGAPSGAPEPVKKKTWSRRKKVVDPSEMVPQMNTRRRKISERSEYPAELGPVRRRKRKRDPEVDAGAQKDQGSATMVCLKIRFDGIPKIRDPAKSGSAEDQELSNFTSSDVLLGQGSGVCSTSPPATRTSEDQDSTQGSEDQSDPTSRIPTCFEVSMDPPISEPIIEAAIKNQDPLIFNASGESSEASASSEAGPKRIGEIVEDQGFQNLGNIPGQDDSTGSVQGSETNKDFEPMKPELQDVAGTDQTRILLATSPDSEASANDHDAKDPNTETTFKKLEAEKPQDQFPKVTVPKDQKLESSEDPGNKGTDPNQQDLMIVKGSEEHSIDLVELIQEKASYQGSENHMEIAQPSVSSEMSSDLPAGPHHVLKEQRRDTSSFSAEYLRADLKKIVKNISIAEEQPSQDSTNPPNSEDKDCRKKRELLPQLDPRSQIAREDLKPKISTPEESEDPARSQVTRIRTTSKPSQSLKIAEKGGDAALSPNLEQHQMPLDAQKELLKEISEQDGEDQRSFRTFRMDLKPSQDEEELESLGTSSAMQDCPGSVKDPRMQEVQLRRQNHSLEDLRRPQLDQAEHLEPNQDGVERRDRRIGGIATLLSASHQDCQTGSEEPQVSQVVPESPAATERQEPLSPQDSGDPVGPPAIKKGKLSRQPGRREGQKPLLGPFQRRSADPQVDNVGSHEVRKDSKILDQQERLQDHHGIWKPSEEQPSSASDLPICSSDPSLSVNDGRSIRDSGPLKLPTSGRPSFRPYRRPQERSQGSHEAAQACRRCSEADHHPSDDSIIDLMIDTSNPRSPPMPFLPEEKPNAIQAHLQKLAAYHAFRCLPTPAISRFLPRPRQNTEPLVDMDKFLDYMIWSLGFGESLRVAIKLPSWLFAVELFEQLSFRDSKLELRFLKNVDFVGQILGQAVMWARNEVVIEEELIQILNNHGQAREYNFFYAFIEAHDLTAKKMLPPPELAHREEHVIICCLNFVSDKWIEGIRITVTELMAFLITMNHFSTEKIFKIGGFPRILEIFEKYFPFPRRLEQIRPIEQ